jgi:hypothetical protein
MNEDEMRIFDALFKGVSTSFGPLTIEKSVENPHFIGRSGLHETTERAMFETDGNVNTRLVSKYASHCLCS